MKKIFFLSLSILLAVTVRAQTSSTTPSAMSLQQCIDYALNNSNAIQNAKIDEEIYRHKRQEVMAMGFPQISASGTLNDFIDIPTTLIPGEFFGAPAGSFIPLKFGTQYNVTGGISANQLIFDGQYLVGLAASKTVMELSKRNTERTKIETEVTVTKAYYNALINTRRLELMSANLDRIKKLADDTKIMYDNGFVEKLDVDRINVTYNNLVVEKENITKLVGLSVLMLKFQMGMDVTAPLTLTDTLKTENFEQLLSATSTIDPVSRIEYKLLQTQRSLYNLDVRRSKMMYLPGLYAFGQYSFNAQRNDFDIFDADKKWYKTSIIGLQLNIPIFDGLQKARIIQQGKLNIMKTENDLINLTNAINLEYANAKIQLQNSTASLKTQKDNMELAQQVYNTTHTKYNLGVGSNLELITAQTALKEAQTNYLNALYDALVAKVDYQKATGQIK